MVIDTRAQIRRGLNGSPCVSSRVLQKEKQRVSVEMVVVIITRLRLRPRGFCGSSTNGNLLQGAYGS